MTAPVYLDASAIVKVVLQEPGSAQLVDFLGGRPDRVSSVVAAIEAPRAILRREPGTEARVVEYIEGLDLVRLGSAVVRRAAALPPPVVRTLDAIHIATAIEIGDLDAFVTYDDRQAEAARALGLPVVSPGAEPSPGASTRPGAEPAGR